MPNEYTSDLRIMPKSGKKARKQGEGCSSCVHKHYCFEFYWHRRFFDRVVEPTMGITCDTWSNKPEDVKPPTLGDIETHEILVNSGIDAEVDDVFFDGGDC